LKYYKPLQAILVLHAITGQRSCWAQTGGAKIATLIFGKNKINGLRIPVALEDFSDFEDEEKTLKALERLY
jgi:hypothetical protein